MTRKIAFLPCLVCLYQPVISAAADPNSAKDARFVQDRFCISFWVDPPADEHMDDHYRLIADAGFTVALGSSHARTPEQITRQLDLCAKYGLKAIVWHGEQFGQPYPDHPACWGYLLKDEPKNPEFPHLAQLVREVRTNRPGKLAYINLYPSHATPKHWGVQTYEEHISRFLKEVSVDVLCFDRYPLMNPDVDERDGYCENLEVIRKHALEAGIPFWNFFCIIPYGRHYDPTEAQVAWQIYTSLAYGAKGILYFSYWTPRGAEFPKGGAIIAVDGRPTRHYDQAKRINARIRNLGPTLMKLTSTRVLRVKPGDDPATVLKGSPIKSLTEGDYLIGVFRHQDGRTAILLNNYRHAYTAWPTVEFATEPGSIVEVDQESGAEIPLRDESPDMNGLQLPLNAGEGRLFLLPTPQASPRIEAVRTFADNVLRYGRDVYGPKHTPLFADGINVDTHEPAVWKLPKEQVERWKMPPQWILSNLASQQNLFRVLAVLTDLTGDPKYRQAAVDATRYAFEHLRHENGLLYWGGHAAWDLATDQPVGEGRTDGIAGKHELKSNYPFYELMWEVDKEATRRFIDDFWASHILQWDILDMNRHGPYLPIPANMWDQPYVGGPVPFSGKGLTFSNTGSDLFYAAATLTDLGGDQRPLLWAKRLAQRYADARHPVTGLGADNYSIIEPDRMIRQFGAEFGDRFTEATVTSLYGTRYHRMAVCQLKLYEKLGHAGEDFKKWAVQDLTAYAKHAYDPADNSFWPTLIDGTRLTPADRKRGGYVELRWLQKRPAEGVHFWAYALAYKLSQDPLMWQMAHSIGRGLGIGDIGTTPDPSWGRRPRRPSDQANEAIGSAPDTAPAPDLATTHADPNSIFGLIELHQATRRDEYLTLAGKIADNLLDQQFNHGFFVTSPDHLFCKFDTITPLALLYLEVTRQKPPIHLPLYAAGRSYFHCSYEGAGRTYDERTIYTTVRTSGTAATTPAAK